MKKLLVVSLVLVIGVCFFSNITLARDRRTRSGTTTAKPTAAPWPVPDASTLDKARIPDGYPLFAGPGKPDELIKNALTWLNYKEKDSDQVTRQNEIRSTLAASVYCYWGEKRKYLAATIVDDWAEDGNYWSSLPVNLAYTTPKLEAKGICVVQVWDVYTKSGKRTPWDKGSVNPLSPTAPFYMKIANLPSGKAASAPQKTAAPVASNTAAAPDKPAPAAASGGGCSVASCSSGVSGLLSFLPLMLFAGVRKFRRFSDR